MNPDHPSLRDTSDYINLRRHLERKGWEFYLPDDLAYTEVYSPEQVASGYASTCGRYTGAMHLRTAVMTAWVVEIRRRLCLWIAPHQPWDETWQDVLTEYERADIKRRTERSRKENP